MARTKQNARKSTAGTIPRSVLLAMRNKARRSSPSISPSALQEVNLDSITITKETTINGQKYIMFQEHDFDGEDRETFSKMMFLCQEGLLSRLEELVDDHNRDSEDDDDNIYNSAKYLLLHNAVDLNTGNRLIDIAAFNGHLNIMEYLLHNGAQIEARNPWKVTHNALDSAIKGGHGEMVNYLIEHGAKAEHKLYLAVKEDQIEIAEILVKGYDFNKANIDALSNNGFNALHLVTKQNKIEIVKKLFALGADPNMKSGPEGHGRAALHLAAENHNCVMIECLIEHFGANVFQKDTNGLTALDLAKKGISTKIPDIGEHYTNLNSKGDVIALLTSKMKSAQETGIQVNSMIENHASKKRRLDIVEPSESSGNCDQTIMPLIESFMNRSFPFEAKIGCLIAINAMIAENPSHCQSMLKKDIVDEIANLADKIIFKVGKQTHKDLSVIAKILAKICESSEGEKLFSDIKMPFSTMERLKSEMKIFERASSPVQFAFDSDHSRKVKTEIQLE